VPVRAGVVMNDSALMVSLAERGVGLAYIFERAVTKQLAEGRLKKVLEPYAPMVPGFFLYFTSRAQSTPALRAFVDAAKELTANQKRS
jgi:DNA-binding transcriptional LysR family regulator